MAQPMLSSDARAALDTYLREAVERGDVPGVVGAVTGRDGELYSGAFGQGDATAQRAMTADAIFRIASMTKPITSVAVMQLIEQGRIALDDPAADHLPDAVPDEVFETFDSAALRYTSRPAASPVTIRHLLTHTSGLGYPFANETLFALLGAAQPSPSVTRYPLLHDPGARWTYGESTRVLGRIVERVSGEPLEAYLQAHIFTPLRMGDTAFSVPPQKRERVVTAHRRTNGALVETANRADRMAAAPRGDGGLYSTAADYTRFMRMFLNGGAGPNGERILSPESIELMGRNHIGGLFVALQPAANRDRTRPFPLGVGRDRFGLGFQITGAHDDGRLRSPGSMSWAGIYNTQFWIDPARGIGAVLLMQYLPFYDDVAIEVLTGFEQRIYEQLR
jgi:CubicO group peptidase (beta-lactamase class C family)